MKKIILLAAFLLSAPLAWSTTLKVEGTCSGKLADETIVTIQYFSDFNGCQKVSRAAMTYLEGREGAITGDRHFTNASDIYRFGDVLLTFPNSTGNTSGKFQYVDDGGKKETVQLQCEVRDYEYADC